MDDQPEVIRQQMEEKRSQLAEKLEALENQVSETVQATTTAVTDTVDAVKETVENVTETVKGTVEQATEAVHSVGKALDIRLQTEQHPWVVFGGSVAVGFTVAQLLPSTSAHTSHGSNDRTWQSRLPALEATSSSQGNGHQAAAAPPPATEARTEPQEESKTSWLWDQIGRLKGLAVGSLMGVVREMAARNLPGAIGQRVAQEVDSITSHLGGEPIHGSLFDNQNKNSSSSQ